MLSGATERASAVRKRLSESRANWEGSNGGRMVSCSPDDRVRTRTGDTFRGRRGIASGENGPLGLDFRVLDLRAKGQGFFGQLHCATRASFLSSTLFASVQRASSSPASRQIAATARRIEAMARHGVAQESSDAVGVRNGAPPAALVSAAGGGGADAEGVTAEVLVGAVFSSGPSSSRRARSSCACASSTVVGSGSGAPPPGDFAACSAAPHPLTSPTASEKHSVCRRMDLMRGASPWVSSMR
jgi:hypothetical protein